MNTKINSVELSGFAGTAPQVSILDNGKKVARFTLATHENYKTKEGEWQHLTIWHQITAWGKVAVKVEELIKQGMRLALKGKLKQRTWADKQGRVHYITEVIAGSVEIVEGVKAA